jgi:hypothetical protein
MEHNDVKRFALVLAVQAEIEGMKAENKRLEFTGDSPRYIKEDFYSKVCELERLAYAHDDQL